MPRDKLDRLSAKLDQRFASIDRTFLSIDKRFYAMDKRFDGMDKRFDGLDGRFDKLENHIDRLTIKVIDMDHYLHTELATKQELADTKNELMAHIDGFITLHQKLDTEVAANRNRCDRIQA